MDDGVTHYREALPADCDQLSALMRDTFCATFAHLYRPEDLNVFLAASYAPAVQYAEIIDPDMDTRMAFNGDRAVGYVQIGPSKLPFDHGPAHALELYRLYVMPEVQGKGVAAALMEWALSRMRERSARQALLGVWSENFRAQKFYARFGFEKVGAYIFPVGEAQDLEFILRAPL